jgi:hypothetical protein
MTDITTVVAVIDVIETTGQRVHNGCPVCPVASVIWVTREVARVKRLERRLAKPLLSQLVMNSAARSSTPCTVEGYHVALPRAVGMPSAINRSQIAA